MEHNGFSSALIKGIVTSAEKQQSYIHKNCQFYTEKARRSSTPAFFIESICLLI